MAPEPVALYPEDKDKDERALFLCVVIETMDGEDGDQGADSCAMTFFPDIFLSYFNCANRQIKLILLLTNGQILSTSV